jgi:hypothetical protein
MKVMIREKSEKGDKKSIAKTITKHLGLLLPTVNLISKDSRCESYG